MKHTAPIQFRRFNPRGVGVFAVLIAIGAESWLMSLRGNTPAAWGETAPPGQAPAKVQATPADAAQMRDLLISMRRHVMHWSASAVSAADTFWCDWTAPTAQATVFAAEPLAAPSEDRSAILDAVAALDLQSVFISDAGSSCMINNVKYEQGQQIDGFTIDAIGPETVGISEGIYHFNLKTR